MIAQAPRFDTNQMASDPKIENPNGKGPAAPETDARPVADENIYLLGRPSLKGYLRFVRHHAIHRPDEGTLTDEWQAANNFIRTLEKEEAGAADNPPIEKLGPDYEPLLIEFLKDPLVRYGFNTVPTEVALVELDRIVVWQKHIDLTHVRNLKQKLSSKLGKEEIFRTCLPYDHPKPPVKWSRVNGETYVFMSPSNDLRYLGALPLESNQITNCAPPGNLVGLAGVAIGFGSNFLNLIYAENRLILNNGSHRSFALRDMGVTHAPAIIQHVSSREELQLVAPSDVVKDPDRYLKHPRPSMMKDYFNPKLRKVIPSHRRVKQVIVKFEVEEFYIPTL